MSKLKTFRHLWKTNKRGIGVVFYNYIVHSGITNIIPDKLYIRLTYYINIGKRLNLDSPKGFNEKLQWLKLYDRIPEYTMMVDKYRVRKYIAQIIGEEHLIPLIGVWYSADDINFDKLPDKFVLKCNHDSGSVIICKDKSKLNIGVVRKRLNKALKSSGYWFGREWPYKNVKPCIIAEKYMVDITEMEMIDYKFMCFNGQHKCTFTCTERFTKDGLKVTFFDTNWRRMPFERHYPASRLDIKKPLNYNEMVEFAERLSRNIPFVRIDFYEVKGVTYFGEITFFPGNGTEEFTPQEWDYRMGSWIELPNMDQI